MGESLSSDRMVIWTINLLVHPSSKEKLMLYIRDKEGRTKSVALTGMKQLL
jgi:hypothetical protein